MGQVVTNSATLMCTFGAAPGTLTVPPASRVSIGSQPVANIMDNKPMANIASFGMCSSLANPQVAAATSAALGTLTPQPCVPVIPAPWAPGSPTVQAGSQPALTQASTCNCTWAGVISITNPGQASITAP